MKTAILTFQDAENYGAALQAYALKTACNNYCETEIVNYYNDYFHRKTDGNGIKAKVKKIINGKTSATKATRFKNFQKKYLTGNSECIERSGISAIDGKYDIYITGSDQVWNLECSGGDKTYFLDFVTSGTKNSYAASFGASKGNDELIEELLSDYSKISVREKSGIRILEKCLNKVVPAVLDPTFLLSKEVWKKQFDLDFSEEFVLVYEVLAGKDLFEQAKIFSKTRNLKLVCITSSDKPRMGAKVIKDAGPIEWLNLISKAKYIFTNSFHGLAFSINFNKQFFVELLPPPANTNTRILELLELFDLNERNSKNALELGDINYTEVNRILVAKRESSNMFLKSIFEEKEYE